jgi:fructoselysine-6-P-deglycase FrlB-like protein
MSIGQIIKDYGTMTACFALAASVTYATVAVTSRFDKIEELAATAQQTVAQVDETVKQIAPLQESLRQDLADFKAALPGAGVAVGEAGANAVTTMDELLECPPERPDCKRGQISNAIKDRIQQLKP